MARLLSGREVAVILEAMQSCRDARLAIQGAFLGEGAVGQGDSVELLHNTHILCDEESLEAAGLTDGSVLTAVRRAPLMALLALSDCTARLVTLDSVASTVVGTAISPAAGDDLREPCRRHQQRIFAGHSAMVNSAELSPDGRWVLTASADCTWRLFDLATGECEHRGVLSSSVAWAKFSPSGAAVLVAPLDRTVQLYTLQGQCSATLRGHRAHVSVAAFSCDEGLVATAAQESAVRLFDAATGLLVQTLEPCAPHKVHSVAFAPCGRQLLAACADCKARLLDFETGVCVRTFADGRRGGIRLAAFSSDAAFVLTVSGEKTVRTVVFDAATGERRCVLEGHSLPLADVVFSSSFGEAVITAESDSGMVRYFDVCTGLCRRSMSYLCLGCLASSVDSYRPRVRSVRLVRCVCTHAAAAEG